MEALIVVLLVGLCAAFVVAIAAIIRAFRSHGEAQEAHETEYDFLWKGEPK